MSQNKLETIIGGTDIEVVRIVPSEEGPKQVTETVKVLKVPIRHMRKLASAWQKEEEEIAVYCDKNPQWVESLSDESFEAVIEEGRRLNAVPFEKWFSRQTQALAALGLTAEQVVKLNLPRPTSS